MNIEKVLNSKCLGSRGEATWKDKTKWIDQINKDTAELRLENWIESPK